MLNFQLIARRSNSPQAKCQLASGKHGTQVFSGFLNIGGQNGKKRDIVKKAAVFHKISNINQMTELQEECEKKAAPCWIHSSNLFFF